MNDPPERVEGQFEEPQFARGFNPHSLHWKRPPKRSPWQRHYELLRANPGQWAKVAEVKTGGPRASRAKITAAQRSFQYYLTKYSPLERWEVTVYTIPETWNQRELYARFIGVLTEEEHERDLVERRLRQEDKMRRARANKEKREAEARRKAEEEEAAAQIRIRARRKPGQ